MWKCTAYWMRREGKRLGRKIPYEYTLAAQIAAGKDGKNKKKDENIYVSKRDGMRKGWIRRSASPWTRRYWILPKTKLSNKHELYSYLFWGSWA